VQTSEVFETFTVGPRTVPSDAPSSVNERLCDNRSGSSAFLFPKIAPRITSYKGEYNKVIKQFNITLVNPCMRWAKFSGIRCECYVI